MPQAFGIVKKDMEEMTIERLRELFPQKKKTINQDLVDMFNYAASDKMFNGDEFLKTLVDYQNCMFETNSGMKDFINAVKFCAYLESEDGNLYQAYKKARAQDDFVKEKADDPVDSPGYNAIVSAASRYRKTPLVRKILAQANMPLWA